MRFLQPDGILATPERLLLGHALAVDGARIAALVPERDVPAGAPLRRFSGELWTAAPVLAHGHLESHDAPSDEWPRDSFAEWVRALLAWRATARRASPAASAQRSLEELARAGCGLVLVHFSEAGADGRRAPDGAAVPRFPEVVAFQEIFAPDPAQAGEWLARLDYRPPPAGGGFALHAPYSISEPLAAGVFARARAWSVRVSIHLGEHREEREILRGCGALADLFRERRQALKERSFDSPVDWLAEVGGLGPATLAVHGGDLDPGELRLLASAGVALAWCPGTHAYFRRPRPAFGRPDLPLPALGCDSRASNSALDPLREARLARELVPEPGPQAWWGALTSGGAAAMRRGDLGALLPGRRARLLRLPWTGEREPVAACDRLTADPKLRPLCPVWEPSAEPEGSGAGVGLESDP